MEPVEGTEEQAHTEGPEEQAHVERPADTGGPTGRKDDEGACIVLMLAVLLDPLQSQGSEHEKQH